MRKSIKTAAITLALTLGAMLIPFSAHAADDEITFEFTGASANYTTPDGFFANSILVPEDEENRTIKVTNKAVDSLLSVRMIDFMLDSDAAPDTIADWVVIHTSLNGDVKKRTIQEWQDTEGQWLFQDYPIKKGESLTFTLGYSFFPEANTGNLSVDGHSYTEFNVQFLMEQDKDSATVTPPPTTNRTDIEMKKMFFIVGGAIVVLSLLLGLATTRKGEIK